MDQVRNPRELIQNPSGFSDFCGLMLMSGLQQ
jgi:hypothetical protein